MNTDKYTEEFISDTMEHVDLLQKRETTVVRGLLITTAVLEVLKKRHLHNMKNVKASTFDTMTAEVLNDITQQLDILCHFLQKLDRASRDEQGS